MVIRSLMIVCIVLAVACAKRDDGSDDRLHPRTAECTQLAAHFLELGRGAADKFKGTPDTPEAWAERWERKCRVERGKIDVPCLMKAATHDDVAHCPETP